RAADAHDVPRGRLARRCQVGGAPLHEDRGGRGRVVVAERVLQEDTAELAAIRERGRDGAGDDHRVGGERRRLGGALHHRDGGEIAGRGAGALAEGERDEAGCEEERGRREGGPRDQRSARHACSVPVRPDGRETYQPHETYQSYQPYQPWASA